MARPTAFDRQTSFTQFSSNYPAKPQNGASLDSEFNAVKIALDETQSNLALIQDDDGKLARGSVGRAQFDSSITLGFESPTPWAADTTYTANLSTVWYEGKFYTATEDHTSTDTFDATKWFEVADLSVSAAIDDGSITDAKLASSAATADKIAPLAVTTPKLASQAVTNPKLADGAVTRAKVADSAGPDLAALILPAGLGPIPWPGAVAPTGWVFIGGTYNREDYPALWTLAAAEIASGVNSWFGPGDGSTTFTIASGNGRQMVGLDAAQSVIHGATTLGAALGAETHAITQSELPAVAPTFSGTTETVSVTSDNANIVVGGVHNAGLGTGGSTIAVLDSGSTVDRPTATGSFKPHGTISNLGSGAAMPLEDPSRVVNYIMKAH